MEYIDINKNLNLGENMGGIRQFIHFALWDDVETFPTKPTTPATLGENAVLTGDIVMKSGKRMFSMYITDDTGEFAIESVGEVDGKSFVQHLTLFHPGLQTTILGFMNSTKNENLVLIATDAEGQQFLMGDSMRPAIFVGSPDGNGTAKETAGRKGMSMEFIYKTGNNHIYSGSIPLTAAV